MKPSPTKAGNASKPTRSAKAETAKGVSAATPQAAPKKAEAAKGGTRPHKEAATSKAHNAPETVQAAPHVSSTASTQKAAAAAGGQTGNLDLLNAMLRAMRDYAPHDSNPSVRQLAVFVFLARNSPHGASLSTIASHFAISKPMAVRVVDHLVTHGYIKKTILRSSGAKLDPTTKRAIRGTQDHPPLHLLVLTPAGRGLIEKIEEVSPSAPAPIEPKPLEWSQTASVKKREASRSPKTKKHEKSEKAADPKKSKPAPLSALDRLNALKERRRLAHAIRRDAGRNAASPA